MSRLHPLFRAAADLQARAVMVLHRPYPKRSALALLLAAIAAVPDRSAADPAPVAASTHDAAPGPDLFAHASQPAPDLHLQPPAPFPPSLGTRRAPPERADDDTRRFIVPAVEALGVNLVVMGWNRWVGAAPWADISSDSIGRNLRSRWVLDDDQFWVNQFGHPYQGTWAFTAARSAGLGFWPAASYSFAASALWEIAGETERPSWNDQVTTTVAGIVLGELLTRFSSALWAEGGTWRQVAASVLSPMSALNRHVVGATRSDEAPASRWELSLGAAFGGLPEAAWRGRAAFNFTWGLPGDPELELARPFDHFVLEAGYGFDADPDATVRARGLLAGAPFHGPPAVQGLYGLFLSFDFDTPGRYRASTSAVGLGASARAEPGGGLALEGDLHGAAVLLGAAGAVDRGPGGKGRDYLVGPGAQSLLEIALLAGSRARTGIAVRQVLVLGEGEPRGTELLVEASARATLRIAGAHGIAIDVSRRVRRARDNVRGTSHEADSALQLSYVLLGGVWDSFASRWAAEPGEGGER